MNRIKLRRQNTHNCLTGWSASFFKTKKQLSFSQQPATGDSDSTATINLTGRSPSVTDAWGDGQFPASCRPPSANDRQRAPRRMVHPTRSRVPDFPDQGPPSRPPPAKPGPGRVNGSESAGFCEPDSCVTSKRKSSISSSQQTYILSGLEGALKGR